jgi:iron complex transport system substrate-binding protein
MQVRKLTVFLALALLLSGCSQSARTGNSLPEGPRIIAAASGSAEILGQIGLKDAIVGVDERNSNASQAPQVTTGHSFNIEQVIALRPTHMIVDSLTDTQEMRKQFKDQGITFVTLPLAESISDIFTKYEILGNEFGQRQQAKKASDELQKKFDAFKGEGRSHRIAFLYLRGTNAIYLMGGKGSGADSLIKALGSVDVGAENSAEPFSPLSAEVMRTINPDVLLLMKGGLESVGGFNGLAALPGLAATTAVQRKQIVVIDDQVLLDFGPRTLEVLTQIKEQLGKIHAA